MTSCLDHNFHCTRREKWNLLTGKSKRETRKQQKETRREEKSPIQSHFYQSTGKTNFQIGNSNQSVFLELTLIVIIALLVLVIIPNYQEADWVCVVAQTALNSKPNRNFRRKNNKTSQFPIHPSSYNQEVLGGKVKAFYN